MFSCTFDCDIINRKSSTMFRLIWHSIKMGTLKYTLSATRGKAKGKLDLFHDSFSLRLIIHKGYYYS